MKEIYLAGGCFWGMEAYFDKIFGVIATDVGYANGYTEKTNYDIVDTTGHAETIHVTYDEKKYFSKRHTTLLPSCGRSHSA